jgi:hypothetical protein
VPDPAPARPWILAFQREQKSTLRSPRPLHLTA